MRSQVQVLAGPHPILPAQTGFPSRSDGFSGDCCCPWAAVGPHTLALSAQGHPGPGDPPPRSWSAARSRRPARRLPPVGQPHALAYRRAILVRNLLLPSARQSNQPPPTRPLWRRPRSGRGHGGTTADPTCPIRVAVRRTHALHQLAGADSMDTDTRRTDAGRMHRTPDVGHQTLDTGRADRTADAGQAPDVGHWTGGRWTRRR
jgi:hypothetical protein